MGNAELAVCSYCGYTVMAAEGCAHCGRPLVRAPSLEGRLGGQAPLRRGERRLHVARQLVQEVQAWLIEQAAGSISAALPTAVQLSNYLETRPEALRERFARLLEELR